MADTPQDQGPAADVTESPVTAQNDAPGTDSPPGDSGPADGPTAPQGQRLERYGTAVVAVPEGRILGADDPVVFDGEETTDGAIIAKEDVYRRVFVGNSIRPTFIKVIHRGARISKRTLTPKRPTTD